MWRNRSARVAPWLWWALVLLAALAALGFAWRNRALVQPWETGVGVLSVLAYATPGALIVARQRGNRIGWLFLGVAGVLAAQGLSAQYAVYAVRVAQRLTPLAIVAAWMQNWVSVLAFFFVSLFVVTYPDGRLPSRRWLLPLAGGSMFWTMLIVGAMFLPEPLDFYPMWADKPVSLLPRNPLALTIPTAPIFSDAVWTGGFLLFVATMTAPLLRYRRAGPLVRQQLRWLMFLASTLIGGFALVILFDELDAALPVFADPLVIMLLGFPLAVSVAILRHNLYDLDVVINRTLVYGALTAALALVYFGGVVLLQLFLPERTALATVLSTLAVAALFNPLRGRLQAWIDRRFYRRKYDAALALAGFAAQARDEVNLERLVATMVSVVQETVQPAHVGVWLRTAERTGSAGGHAEAAST